MSKDKYAPQKRYYWKHREKILKRSRKYSKKYYWENREKLLSNLKRKRYSAQKKYNDKAKKLEYLGYIGICICPICNNKGYLYKRRWINIFTGWTNEHYNVNHQHTEKGKTIHDKTCYVTKRNMFPYMIKIRRMHLLK